MSGRNVPAPMVANLESAAPRYCYLLKVIPKLPDIAPLGITNWDVDQVMDITYYARRGFDSYANEMTADLAVDNSEVRFLISEDYFDGITQDAIRRGDYDGARFYQWMIEPDNAADGVVIFCSGTVGRITNVDGLEGTLELRSLTQTLKQKSIIELGSNNCRVVQFGDERCGVDVDILWIDTIVTDVGIETDRVFTIDGDYLDLTDDTYWPGVYEFYTGANAGRTYEVESYIGGVVTLAIPTEEPITDTDTGRIRPDCTRLWGAPLTEDHNSCNFYENRPNFRGEPKRPVSETAALMASGAASPSSGPAGETAP